MANGNVAQGGFTGPQIDAILANLGGIFGGDQQLIDAATGGLGVGGQFFAPGALGRVDPSLNQDQALLLQTLRQNLASAGGPSSPFTQETFGRLTSQADVAGQRSQETADLLQQLQGQVGAAGQVDPELQAILERRRAGLEGLTAPELTALREQGAEEINRNLQTALRAAGQQNITRNLSGGVTGATIPGITREALLARRGLERDIFLENVGERNRRLNEFQGLAGAIDAARFGRTQEALGALGGALSGAEAAEFGRGFSANQALNQALIDRQRFQEAQRLAAASQFGSGLQNIRNDLLQRQLFNIGQGGQERAGLLGLIFGAGGFGAAQQAQQQGFDLSQQAIEAGSQPIEVPEIDFSGLFGGFGGFGTNTGSGFATEVTSPSQLQGFSKNPTQGFIPV